MISTSIFISAAISLVLLLLLTTSREDVEENAKGGSPGPGWRDSRDALQRPELVFRIFSREDREFILHMRSPRLQRIYQEERRKVALHWVQRTSHEVSKIMRAHRLLSRESHNLDVGAEAKLFVQYLRLQLTCGLLVLLIKTFGPHALSDLAAHAGELYQRLGRALPDVVAANRIAASEDTATH